jgi:hypothetical protein
MGGEDVPGERSSDPGDLLPLTPVALNVLLALAQQSTAAAIKDNKRTAFLIPTTFFDERGEMQASKSGR